MKTHILVSSAVALVVALLSARDGHACGSTTSCNTVSGGDGYDGTTDTAYGVHGDASNSAGFGLFGTNSAGGVGVNGVSISTTGGSLNIGVVGSSKATSGTGYGVYGAIYGNTGSQYAIYGTDQGNSTSWAGYFSGNVNITGTLTCGSGCSSDQRLKQNIKPFTGSIDKLLQLKGVTFEWKNPEEHQKHMGTQIGVIAQDVQKVFPQWVGETDKGFLTVDPDARTMLGLTVEGFRELKEENDALKDRVKALESGRRPLVSGFGEGGLGLGLMAVAGAIGMTRRKRSDDAGTP